MEGDPKYILCRETSRGVFIFKNIGNKVVSPYLNVQERAYVPGED